MVINEMFPEVEPYYFRVFQAVGGDVFCLKIMLLFQQRQIEMHPGSMLLAFLMLQNLKMQGVNKAGLICFT